MNDPSLGSTEELIKKITGEIISPLFYGTDESLEEALYIRCRLINDRIKFSPEIITQIERVNNLLIESREKVWQKMRSLSRQMLQLRESGKDVFMDDFEIEGNISIIFKDESSIFPLTKDENQEESDYPAMAEILNDFTLTNPIFFPSLFHFDKDVDWRANDDDLGMIYHKPYVIRSLY
jgi:hypothetical protein